MATQTVLIATGNRGKVAEFERLLAPQGIAVTTLAALTDYVPPEETGTTFEENALIKARAAAAAFGGVAIADDSGLIVDALDGEPGVRSARFGGPGLDDEGRYAHLLERLRSVSQRSARFVCVMAVARPDGSAETCVGACEGEILTAPQGRGGFGYDPVFAPQGANRSFAEFSPAEKDAVSHRGQAAAQLPARLRRVLISC